VSLDAAGLPGQIRGRVRDANGAVLPGATVTLGINGTERTAISDNDGSFLFTGVPSGSLNLDARLGGFTTSRRSFTYDGQGRTLDMVVTVNGPGESITVTGERPIADTQTARRAVEDRVTVREDRAQKTVAPSENVINLQRRTSGVLPIRVDVPRAGTSHQFVKPLVVDQETVVTLRYKRR
jgi:hypothetical protein